MKVFVVGTGRCGTVSFATACHRCISNYKSTHESTGGMKNPAHLAFADARIEVSPYLSWMLGPLAKANPTGDVLFVHLQRRRAEVVRSWVKRGPSMGPGLWTKLALRVNAGTMTASQYHAACGLCYDSIVGTIESFLAGWEKIPNLVEPMHIWLHEIETQWPLFWRRIGATGDYQRSVAGWKVKQNASRT